MLEDQVDGLHAAAERYPFLDLERVAIRGWSFGGFLAAMAVLRRPDVFHAAVSGAPVTDGELYDTHYTERYLGMPDTDVEAYARYRLLDDAPNLRRPLLLIHGLADDNVYVANTLRLSKALLEAGRFHSVIPLSGITHAPSQPEVAENLLLLQVRFLRDALGLPIRTWPIRPEAAATLGRIANGGPLSVPIIVQKYGGTSVGTTERIQAVADRVVRAKEDGFDVLVAVSAMGDTTDDLLAMAKQIAPVPNPRELDMLLTAGERIAMSLLAIAINARGCKAASYTGSQAGIITDTQHGAARIVEIRPKRILESLGEGNVVIVAGFQGLSTNYDITTLGRGGSDTTAVAMAGGRRRRGLRDLHRRAGRVHRRSADRAGRAEGRDDLVRGDARARRRRREGPEFAVGGVRSAPRREAPRAVVVRRRARHVGAGGGRSADGRRADLGRRARQRRGEGDARRVPDRPGCGGDGVPRDRRRGHQRRHDRAERVARRRHRPVVHRAARRHPSPAVGHGARREGDRRDAVLDRRRASRRSRSSGRA